MSIDFCPFAHIHLLMLNFRAGILSLSHLIPFEPAKPYRRLTLNNIIAKKSKNQISSQIKKPFFLGCDDPIINMKIWAFTISA